MSLMSPFKNFTKRDALLASVCVLGLLLVTVEPSFAQTTGVDAQGGFQEGSRVGQGVLNVGTDVIFGNLGLLAGIAFAAFGAFQWLVKQNTAVGIGSIVFGAVLALSDNLMQGIYSTIASPIVSLLDTGSGN